MLIRNLQPMYITCDELANSKIFEQFPQFVRMNGVKLFSAVDADIYEDAIDATEVLFEQAGVVVDMSMDDDPSRVRGAVLDQKHRKMKT